MKIPLTLLTVLAVLSVGSTAGASNTSPGLISRIHIMNNGLVFFHHAGQRAPAPPTCHTNGTRWAFDGATPAGQAKLSALLSAYALKKPITIVGLDVCNAWPDTETVNYFIIED